MEIIYFYKEDETNIPIIYGTANDYSFLVQNDEVKKKIQKDYPQSKNNLFVLVQGFEFKVPFV